MPMTTSRGDHGLGIDTLLLALAWGYEWMRPRRKTPARYPPARGRGLWPGPHSFISILSAGPSGAWPWPGAPSGGEWKAPREVSQSVSQSQRPSESQLIDCVGGGGQRGGDGAKMPRLRRTAARTLDDKPPALRARLKGLTRRPVARARGVWNQYVSAQQQLPKHATSSQRAAGGWWERPAPS